MGRVTYIHHYVRPLVHSSDNCSLKSTTQLPTLYFSVLMLAHLIDHFIFASRRFTEKTKWIVFGVCAGSIVLCFWWWKGVAFGILGPAHEHWGLKWRKVSLLSACIIDSFANVAFRSSRRGTSTTNVAAPPCRVHSNSNICVLLTMDNIYTVFCMWYRATVCVWCVRQRYACASERKVRNVKKN